MQIEQQVVDVVTALKPELMVALVQGIIVVGALLFLKDYAEAWVQYWLFSMNKRLGINVRVEVRGSRGVITTFNRRWIIVRSEDGHDIIIQTRRWQFEQWKIIDPYKWNGANEEMVDPTP